MDTTQEDKGASSMKIMVLPDFEKFERNEEWFSKNFQKIEEKYRDKFLAILAPGKIMADVNLENLLDRVEKKGKIESAFVTAIPPKGVASIL